MFCKKCGAALPSHGFICTSCGAMMSSEQIAEQKKFIKEQENKRTEVNLLSDRYSKEPINRDYRVKKESKLLGILFILLVIIFLIIIAILKVM